MTNLKSKNLLIYFFLLSLLSCNTKNEKMDIVNEAQFSEKIRVEKTFTHRFSDDEKKCLLSSRIGDFEVDKNGSIYILDVQAANIKVFDSTFQLKNLIGKRGAGPGEFIENRKMHLMNDSLLLVADEALNRMNIIHVNGSYVSDFKYSSQVIDDIVYRDEKYFISSYEMKRDHIPIRIMDGNFNLLKRFGEILPIRKNLFEDLAKLRNSRIYERYLSNGTFTKLAFTDKYIFYAQRNPYKIFKYDYNGNLLTKFSTKTDFSSDLDIDFYEHEDVSGVNHGPQSSFNNIHIINDSLLFALLVKPGKNIEDTSMFESFIDFYDIDGKNIHRMQISIDGYYPYHLIKTYFRKETGYLYVLICSKKFSPVCNIFKITTD